MTSPDDNLQAVFQYLVKMMPRPAPSTPSAVGPPLRIFDLSLGQMLWSRRSVFLALLVGGPVVLAVIIRMVSAGVAGVRRSGSTAPRSAARRSSA